MINDPHIVTRPWNSVGNTFDPVGSILLSQLLQQLIIQTDRIRSLHRQMKVRFVTFQPIVQGELTNAQYFEFLFSNIFLPSFSCQIFEQSDA